MKLASFCDAIQSLNEALPDDQIRHILVHTGQPYDAKMTEVFFNDLDLPKPDVCLGAGFGSHAFRTARIMEQFEKVLLSEQPNLVVVVGDVDSTVACALVTKKTYCRAGNGGGGFIPKLAHVEAGLRSFDRTMPEELNRIVTDALADFLFTTEESANRNLLREGVAREKIFFVGNVMIDTMLRYRKRANESAILSDLQLTTAGQTKPYAILTIHRPVNVENVATLAKMLEAFLELSKRMPVIFPAHPLTLRQIQAADLGDFFVDHFIDGPEPWDHRIRIRLVPPLGYLDFLRLLSEATIVLTDSGGIQEETAILGVPCLTLLENTERPVTLECGTNVVVGSRPERIIDEFTRVLRGDRKKGMVPKLWDGQAAARILRILRKEMAGSEERSPEGQICALGGEVL